MSELASCIFRKKSCHVAISTDSALSKTFLLLSIQCSPLIEYYRTIAHAGCDNKGAKSIYKLSTPCLKASREVLSTKWLWKAVPYPYTVWEEGMPLGWSSDIWDNESMWPLATDDAVYSSNGGIATRPFTILYSITALDLVLLSANGCHCCQEKQGRKCHTALL